MKTLNIFLVAFFTLSLTACGGSSGGSTASNNTGNNGNGGTELDRCIERVITDATIEGKAITSEEVLALCGVVNPPVVNPPVSGGDTGGATGSIADSHILVKPMGMLSPETIIEDAVDYDKPLYVERMHSRYISEASVLCDGVSRSDLEYNSYVYTKDNSQWHNGDKTTQGFYLLEKDGAKDNCLVTTRFVNIDEVEQEQRSTMYRADKIAYLDIISTLAMARITQEDPREMVNEVNYDNTTSSDLRSESRLPTNENYEAAEKEIIDQVKNSPYYDIAKVGVELSIASKATDPQFDTYMRIKDRAILNSALFLIREDARENGSTLTIDDIISIYKDGSDLLTAFGVTN